MKEKGLTTMTHIAQSKTQLSISKNGQYIRVIYTDMIAKKSSICSFPITEVWDYLKDTLAATEYDEAGLIRRHNEACETKAYHLKDKE